MINAVVLFIVIIAVIGFSFLWHETKSWNTFAHEALNTCCCPFCGRHLEKYTIDGKYGRRDIYYCKICDFSVSTENHVAKEGDL